jgi:hypothetical protein
MFLTIIADYYSEIAKDDNFLLEEEDPELFEYLKEKLSFLIPSSYFKKDQEEAVKKNQTELFPQKVHQLVRYMNKVIFFLIDSHFNLFILTFI